MESAIDRMLGSVHSSRQDRVKLRGSRFIRPPFAWPGGKHGMVDKVCENLPHSKVFVDVFGGSGTVSINHRGSALSIYNDRLSGVVAFYNCLRDPVKYKEMIELLELMPHSPEMFDIAKAQAVFCTETAMYDPNRAAAWYYTIVGSFASLGRNWGFDLIKDTVVKKFRNKLTEFQRIHSVFSRITIENLDWEDCINKYDSKDTLFYLDPPYLECSSGIYKSNMLIADHRRMIDLVFKLKGKVVMSHYDHWLYRKYDWSKTVEFDKFVSIKSTNVGERSHKKEVLWVK